MRAVELFSGIGGFRIACDRIGIETVWANDISEPACSVYRSRFGSDALVEGPIEEMVESVPAHDLLTAGFPCQPFSSAGKKLGIEDPRGTLFQVIVDVLRARRPKRFILENVKRLLTMDRGRHFATILDALADLDYTIEWRLLNAMDVGLPQNRQRVLIVGVLDDTIPDHSVSRLSSSQEFDELDIDWWRALSQEPSWTKIVAHGARFPTWGIARRGRFHGADVSAPSDARPLVRLREVLQEAAEVGAEFDFTQSTVERLKDSVPVNRYVGGVEILSNQGGGARMGYTVFGVNGVAPTLTSSQSRHYERYKIGTRYRRLTNVEYARIQGFPDNHCAAVNVYSQYVLFGNAVPPSMAEWALRRAIADGQKLNSAAIVSRQTDLFSHVG